LKNKIIIISTLIITFSILFSGCINSDEQNNDQSGIGSIDTIPPISVITAPVVGFFGQEIEISAKNSYDPDGDIISYKWLFGDDETDQGETISHIFKQNYELNNISFPIKFEITLELFDNDNLVNYSIHYIDLYPEKYQYYLKTDTLLLEKPSSDFDNLKASLGISNVFPSIEYKYQLSNSVIINPCDWTVTIYVEKPIIAIFNQISLTLYNKTDEIIIQTEDQYSFFEFWTKKTITFSGTFASPIEFNSLSIKIKGFSIRDNIKILYGGEKASNILFDFTSSS